MTNKKNWNLNWIYLLSLTVEERFQMMFEKSRIIKDILVRNGHRKAFEIIKRK